MSSLFEDRWWPMVSNFPHGFYLTECPPYIEPARMTWGTEKQTAIIHLTQEHLANLECFERLGHYEDFDPGDEARDKHKRARELLEEIVANEYIEWWDIQIEPLETQRWVFDETVEEWLQRWRDSKS